MGSTVSSQASYYDALGLSPTATQDEIARAFGKAMGLFGAHSVAAAAQLGAAFETLRNPAKRRAYDASIGLAPKPQALRAPTSVSFRISAQPEPHVEPRAAAAPAPRPEPAAEPAPSSFIASALRDIAKPVAIDTGSGTAAKKHPPRPHEELSAAALQRLLGPQAGERESRGEAEDRPIDWRRPAVAFGAVVLAAGLVGGLAGVSVKDDEQGQTAITAALPPARAHAHVAAPAAADPATSPMVGQIPATEAPQPIRVSGFRARPGRIAAPQPVGQAASAPADAVQAIDPAAAPADSSPTAAADPLAAQPEALETVAAASLPLATKLVARTIDRIGYACGEVASASPADGEPAGVYKVTCTSGQTYRAAPVHGRYHFRRWSSR